jgi:hypothetical protein
MIPIELVKPWMYVLPPIGPISPLQTMPVTGKPRNWFANTPQSTPASPYLKVQESANRAKRVHRRAALTKQQDSKILEVADGGEPSRSSSSASRIRPHRFFQNIAKYC